MDNRLPSACLIPSWTMNVILSLLCVGRIDIFGRKSVVLLKSNPQSPELGCSGSSTIELSLHKSGLEIGIGGSYYPLQLLVINNLLLNAFKVNSSQEDSTTFYN